MIQLNEKDADFILRFIRVDLERLNGNLNELHQSNNDLKETYEKSNMKDSLMAKCMMDLAEEVTTKTTEGLSEIKNDLIHCIDLLTTGSEVSA